MILQLSRISSKMNWSKLLKLILVLLLESWKIINLRHQFLYNTRILGCNGSQWRRLFGKQWILNLLLSFLFWDKGWAQWTFRWVNLFEVFVKFLVTKIYEFKLRRSLPSLLFTLILILFLLACVLILSLKNILKSICLLLASIWVLLLFLPKNAHLFTLIILLFIHIEEIRCTLILRLILAKRVVALLFILLILILAKILEHIRLCLLIFALIIFLIDLTLILTKVFKSWWLDNGPRSKARSFHQWGYTSLNDFTFIFILNLIIHSLICVLLVFLRLFKLLPNFLISLRQFLTLFMHLIYFLNHRKTRIDLFLFL